MNTKLIISLIIILNQFFVLTIAHAQSHEPITLRVALYPYVPNRQALFHKVEKIFESQNPGVNLELAEDSEFMKEYYSGGLQKANADVYEVDTILLSDLIKLGKIASIKLPSGSFTEESIAAVTREGKTYGVPHWLCGNFLFYRKGDKEIENAETWEEINKILASRNEAIFFDFKGKSTLGEWYLTTLSGIHGLEKSQQLVMKGKELDDSVVQNLKAMLKSCPDGFCRNYDLHNRTGYYARAFISGKSSGYIGYSESIHYGIQHSIDFCTQMSGCIPIDNIAVRRLPHFSGSVEHDGIGWVDALAIDSEIDPKKKELAIKFITFMVSDEAYRTILEANSGEAPAYLIPARTGVQIDKAPLYDSFYKAHLGRKTGTLTGLNDQLREISKKLDCALPIDRTDAGTLTECHK